MLKAWPWLKGSCFTVVKRLAGGEPVGGGEGNADKDGIVEAAEAAAAPSKLG